MKKMMNRLAALLMAVVLIMTGGAMAQSVPEEQFWTEQVYYRGDGIFEIDFMRDLAWKTDYTISVQDMNGNILPVTVLGGDADEAVVRIGEGAQENMLYIFSFASEANVVRAVGQSMAGFTYDNYCEYCLAFGHDDDACAERKDSFVLTVDRCNLCGELNHDEENCPERIQGLDYCGECGKYGHDDNACPYEDDMRYERCDWCSQLGHDEDFCPNRAQPTPMPELQPMATPTPIQQLQPMITPTAWPMAQPTPQPTKGIRCDECGMYGHDDDLCPYERCDECGAYGHDDDRCPKQVCSRCGEKGHKRGDCPEKPCDECGQTGHDDDHCPNERCDECGQVGHDDDRCPYDRDED